MLQKSKITGKYHNFFSSLVLATAWQESCFRQFKVKNRKVVYLLSYNNTSVGLMQVNERVWRGLYNLHHLRWDIRYNAMAGCEIIANYFYKYLINNKKQSNLKTLNFNTLGQITYAMYNGGPSQLKKFLKRRKRGKFFLSDRLFLEKYHWVKKDRWKNINKCLTLM